VETGRRKRLQPSNKVLNAGEQHGTARRLMGLTGVFSDKGPERRKTTEAEVKELHAKDWEVGSPKMIFVTRAEATLSRVNASQ